MKTNKTTATGKLIIRFDNELVTIIKNDLKIAGEAKNKLINNIKHTLDSSSLSVA